MGREADLAFVVDDRAGIDDDRVGQFRIRAHHRAGGNDDVASQPRRRGNGRRGMHRIDQLKALLADKLAIAGSGPIIPNGDDHAARFRFELGQKIHLPQHGQPADGRAVEGRRRVEKAHRPVQSGRAQDVQNDLPMPARADDKHVHSRSRKGCPVAVIGRSCLRALMVQEFKGVQGFKSLAGFSLELLNP